MRYHIFLITIFTSAVSCVSTSDEGNFGIVDSLIEEVHHTEFFGKSFSQTNSTTISYNEKGLMDKLVFNEASEVDTIFSIYRIEYDERDRVSKVYRRHVSDELNPSDTENLHLEIDYLNNYLFSLSYDAFLLKDFIYEDGLIKSLKVFYHYQNDIFPEMTRLQQMEYDSTQMIIGFKDSRISDGTLYSDISILFDSNYNPLYKSVLSMVPYFDLLSYQSQNNIVKIQKRNAKSLMRDYEIDIKYSKQGEPMTFTAKNESGILYLDTIYFKTGSNTR